LTTKQIHLNAFEMNCVGHLARGMWRHPADMRYRCTDLEYWNAEARLLEERLFGAGRALLPATHPAAVCRRTSALAIR
jgi:hypothetical protein